MQIDAKRLGQRLDELNKIGYLHGGGVSRPALSSEDKQARDLLTRWMKAVDLVAKVDEIGNMFGVWPGKSDHAIGSGSHLDTVPTGGYFDGALGVLAALEVVETLKETGYRPNHSLVITNFTNEEGVRFTPDMMGSMAHADPALLSRLLLAKSTDDQRSVQQELQRIGYAGAMQCGSIPFEKFIELHIEQGPFLENENMDIGVVMGVQAIHWRKLTITGKSAHAGTTPMASRKDAFYALSCLSGFARGLCESERDLLITIGTVAVTPNVINVVPEKVAATLDIRHPDDGVLTKQIASISEFIRRDLSFRDLGTQWEILVDVKAVRFDQSIIQTIQRSCDERGYSSQKMTSGAGHDAQLLSSRFASGMIFIPSRNGISHAIDEYSSPQQIEKGANVLLDTILRLDSFRY